MACLDGASVWNWLMMKEKNFDCEGLRLDVRGSLLGHFLVGGCWVGRAEMAELMMTQVDWKCIVLVLIHVFFQQRSRGLGKTTTTRRASKTSKNGPSLKKFGGIPCVQGGESNGYRVGVLFLTVIFDFYLH